MGRDGQLRRPAIFASIVIVIVGVMTASTAPAFANHVSVGPTVRGNVLLYQGAQGADQVSISGSAGTYSVSDPHGFKAQSGCTQVSHTEATCTGTVDLIWVRTAGGDDTAYVNSDVPAEIRGGDGNDTLIGGPEADTFIGGAGGDSMSGGGGTDAADYSRPVGSAGVRVSLDGVANDGVTGEGDNVQPDIETVKGTQFADSFSGSKGPDTFYGLKGDDLLIGHEGNDLLVGGPGNDNLQGRAGNDTVTGGAGDDFINGDTGNDVETGGVGNDILGDVQGLDSLSGGKGDDTIDGADSAVGGPHDSDTVSCGAGTDDARVDNTDVVQSCENVTVF